MDQMSLNNMILNACTLDTHTAVDTGNNLWASDVFKLYDLEYMYSGYTYCCRPWIHFMSRCFKKIMNLNTCTLDTHAVVDLGYTLWTRCLYTILNACTLDTLYGIQMSLYYMILSTSTLDTHPAVDPGYTLWTTGF